VKSAFFATIAMLTAMAAGCGSKEPQSKDPAAIERENTEGKQLREKLEGWQPEK
jgi:hypothetical protein